MKYKGKQLQEPSEICQAFAEYFGSNYATQNNSNTLPEISVLGDELHIDQFEVEEIYDALLSLKSKASSGIDEIPAYVVRDCASVFAKPLQVIFKLAIEKSVFPDIWKNSLVTPIFKKGSKSDVECYRPISLIPNFAKVFEIVLHKYLSNYTSRKLNESQYGIVKGKLTITNLFTITQYLCEHLDKKYQVDVVYTDFSKAFDSIDHLLLIRKLDRFGFSDGLLKLFESYLTRRKQFVVAHGERSGPIIVTSGVPQGSVLGPLLFNIFINDISSSFDSEHLLFADDLKIYNIIRSADDFHMIQHDLNRLFEWCAANKLHLNIDKCAIMTFSGRQVQVDHFVYRLNHKALNRVEEFKDLGVMFTKHLTFASHVQHIVNQSFKSLGYVIRNTKQFDNIATIKTLYSAFVRCHLEYACIIWDPSTGSMTSVLERVQRRFLKYLYFRTNSSYPPIGYSQEILLSRYDHSKYILIQEFHRQ